METINVTLIEPRLKHPTIFEKYDTLLEEQEFVIHNDHDPKPLYYQLLAERGQTFEWEYLLNGPEIWEVKIKKLKIGEKPETIGQMVVNDFRRAEVFRKFGLDFCCGGKKTLEQACAKKGLDVLQVKEELKKVEEKDDTNHENYDSWELNFLADYIVNRHHSYVKESHPMLLEYSQKVARVHGERHPELIQIANDYLEIAEELSMHMNKEEMILFPYIKEMVDCKKEGRKMERAPFGSIENPINMMESEHTAVGEVTERMKELSNNFIPPEDACNSYRVLFSKLKEYEKDLHHHIHLENNILFKKAIELESEFFS